MAPTPINTLLLAPVEVAPLAAPEDWDCSPVDWKQREKQLKYVRYMVCIFHANQNAVAGAPGGLRLLLGAL